MTHVVTFLAVCAARSQSRGVVCPASGGEVPKVRDNVALGNVTCLLLMHVADRVWLGMRQSTRDKEDGENET